MKKKYSILNIDEFLSLYRDYFSCDTWTKEKKIKFNLLEEFLSKHSHVTITSKRDNPTTKIQVQKGFTIFKVKPNQRGHMKIYRNKWVLMFNLWRYTYTHFLMIFPINREFGLYESQSLKKEFDYRYEDNIFS